MNKPLTAQEAATELHALINSRVSSPRIEEIVAIVAKVAPMPPAAPEEATARISALRAAVAACEQERYLPEGISDASERLLTRLSEAVYSRPVTSFSDLQERAIIARHWTSTFAVDGEGLSMPWVNPTDLDDWGNQTIAELIDAVLNFGALSLSLRRGVLSIHAEVVRVATEYRDAWDNDSAQRVYRSGARPAALSARYPVRATARAAARAEIVLAHANEEPTETGEPCYCAESDAQQAACRNLVVPKWGSRSLASLGQRKNAATVRRHASDCWSSRRATRGQALGGPEIVDPTSAHRKGGKFSATCGKLRRWASSANGPSYPGMRCGLATTRAELGPESPMKVLYSAGVMGLVPVPVGQNCTSSYRPHRASGLQWVLGEIADASQTCRSRCGKRGRITKWLSLAPNALFAIALALGPSSATGYCDHKAPAQVRVLANNAAEDAGITGQSAVSPLGPVTFGMRPAPEMRLATFGVP